MSAETDAIIQFIKATGVPHKVTSTTGGRHAAGSYHFKGLAVDLAGPTPSRDSPALLAIFAAFTKIETQLFELIYAGAPYNIKRGQRVPLYAVSGHHDHVHVAVNKGFRWTTPPSSTPKVTPMYSPPLTVVASLEPPSGGVWLLAPDGAIFAFGGASYLGGANNQSYFVGRKAARLEMNGDGYTIVAESGERYDYAG